MRRKVKPIKKPKLHIVDEVTYALTMTFSIFAGIVVGALTNKIQREIVEGYENIIAYFFWDGPWIAGGALIFVLPTIAAVRLYKKVPLFKKTREQKAATKYFKENKIHNWIAGILVSLSLILSIIMTPYQLCERYQLRSDGLVSYYLSTNEVTESFYMLPENAQSVEFSVYREGGGARHASEEGFAMVFTGVDGNSIRIIDEHFASTDAALEFMLDFKSKLPDDVEIICSGMKKIPTVSFWMGLTDLQEQALYELLKERPST